MPKNIGIDSITKIGLRYIKIWPKQFNS